MMNSNVIKIKKSKFDREDGNVWGFLEEQIKLKKEENRSASSHWMEWDQMPEKMYRIFVKYVQKKAESQNHIVFFDIGAAEGCYTYPIRMYFDSFHIVAFEPEDERFEVFLENISPLVKDKNERKCSIELIQKLVTDGSSETETLRHYSCIHTGGGAGSSRIHKADRPNREHYDVRYEAVSLNDFTDKYTKVDAIKIDVEGAECLVLNGANKFLEKHRPVIFLEIHSHPDNGGVTLEDVKQSMEKVRVNYSYNEIETHRGPQLSYYLLKPLS